VRHRKTVALMTAKTRVFAIWFSEPCKNTHRVWMHAIRQPSLASLLSSAKTGVLFRARLSWRATLGGVARGIAFAKDRCARRNVTPAVTDSRRRKSCHAASQLWS
jgi:hypothetical protein